MDPNSQIPFKDRLNVFLFLRNRLSQISATGSSQFQKYYNKVIESLSSYHEIILDENGTILSWNSDFEKLEGYKEDEIIGQSINLFYLPGDRQEKLPEKLLQSASSNGKCRYFGQFVKKGGTTYWANLIMTAIKKENNQLLGYIVICRRAAQKVV